MNEIYGNALDYISRVDAICITTNGAVKSNGACVMGAGIAKTFRDKFQDIDLILGKAIKKNGNVTQIICEIDGTKIIAFPTKHVWDEGSDLNLIEKSYLQLVDIINECNLNNVILPRPGCSNGGLDWKTVKFRLYPIWDSRVTIISLL